MGPKRYDIAGIKTFLRSKAYSGTISFRGECRNLSTRQGLENIPAIFTANGEKGGKLKASLLVKFP